MEEIKARAKMITDTCILIQEHVAKQILTSPYQVSTILEILIKDANRIIELVDQQEQ